MRTSIRSALYIVLATGALGACSSSPGTEAAPPSSEAGAGTEIRIAGFRYQPETLEVPAGTTMRWTNEDEILHTVTGGTPDAPESDPLDGTLDGVGTTYETTLEEPGEYRYFCSRHESMTASLTVT